jgi:23S rRNA (adenine2503-C2)-methyltransferase
VVEERSVTESAANKTPLVGLDLPAIRSLCADLGLKPFHPAEIYRWIYGRRSLDPSGWTNLPLEARSALSERSVPGLPEVAGEQRSSDGTRKFLLRLHDGETIEAVYIPDGDRRTVCVSSQVGCAMGCTFCLTARMGLRRNLTPSEILSQFFVLEARTDIASTSYNVVFMGMGEPMANRANLEAALALLEDPDGMAVSPRRITVSTSGLADQFEAFAASPVCPRLSLSLNAARDDLRTRLMPINQGFPLKRLRTVLQNLTRKERERISLEYVLLGGENDSERDAEDVARFAKGLKVKVNLISFNAAEGLPFRPSAPEATAAFQEILLRQGITATVRRSRGLDILAACGQLARKHWPDEVAP